MNQNNLEVQNLTGLLEKLSKVKLVVLDIDGTITDGSLYYSKNGLELKKFNVKDGLAITLLRFIGIDVLFLTSEKSEIIDARANKLKIEYVIQNTHNKLVELTNFISGKGISFSEVLYIGDDINDFEAMGEVGVSACPNNSSTYIKDVSDYVSQFAGGEGAVREIIELLMEAKGQDILSVYKNFKLKIEYNHQN